MSARSHAAGETRGRRERDASSLLGIDVREVPKATLAIVAFYLALAIDESAGMDGATARLWEEWRILRQNGIIDVECPIDVKARKAQRKAGR